MNLREFICVFCFLSTWSRHNLLTKPVHCPNFNHSFLYFVTSRSSTPNKHPHFSLFTKTQTPKILDAPKQRQPLVCHNLFTLFFNINGKPLTKIHVFVLFVSLSIYFFLCTPATITSFYRNTRPFMKKIETKRQ